MSASAPGRQKQVVCQGGTALFTACPGHVPASSGPATLLEAGDRVSQENGLSEGSMGQICALVRHPDSLHFSSPPVLALPRQSKHPMVASPVTLWMVGPEEAMQLAGQASGAVLAGRAPFPRMPWSPGAPGWPRDVLHAHPCLLWPRVHSAL